MTRKHTTKTLALSEKRVRPKLTPAAKAEAKHLAQHERHKVHDVAAEIAKVWNAMTPEEQKAATDPLLEELQEYRDSMAFGRRNVQLESVGDATQSLASLEHNIKALYARTGTEVILIAVRPRAQDFFYNTYKVGIHDLCSRFEAYSVAGIEGVVNKQGDGTAKLKSELISIINENLEALVGPKTRMVYVNFESKFTWNLGICLDGWPLPKFCSPSDLKTRAEVTLLLSAWKSGTTHFRQMGQEEWKQWREKRQRTSATTAATASRSDLPPAESMPSRPSSPENPQEELHATSPSTDHPEPVLSPNPSSQGPIPTSTGVIASSGKQNSVEFIHSSGVTLAMGDTLIITKRQRKERSDKGVKRGPRAKKTASTSPATPQPSNT
ncbi:hypothetical protein C0992_005414 [Termitomyces sp. T32_za158]|nr:hypothetical protein C0992_005414 [Termitomyces sp. T32_za158]